MRVSRHDVNDTLRMKYNPLILLNISLNSAGFLFFASVLPLV